MFKQDLINHANRLASWTVDKDCCDWVGVVCDNVTGHVLQLHLTNPLSSPGNLYARDADYEAFERSKLRGKINPSLLMLKHLNYLDLSNNAFEGIPIPKFLGSIESLRYLNLSHAGFKGLVPHQLGNLSSLQILNLADDEGYLYVANLQWLSGLSSLEHLDLSNVSLIEVSNWLKVVNTLPSLQDLYLSGCQLPQVPPPANLNLSSLTILDLSSNSLENTLVDFSWIFQLKSLVSLDLSGNNFQGCIFDGLENMTSLTHLDLSDNSFNSSIPDWLYNLNSLQFLSLRFNYLQGLISSAVGNMSSAISLDFSGNELEGKIPRSMGNLCNLKSIDYSGYIPDQLCALDSLQVLDLSYNDLFGSLPRCLSNFSAMVKTSGTTETYTSLAPLIVMKGQMLDYQILSRIFVASIVMKGQMLEYSTTLDLVRSIDFSNNNLSGEIPVELQSLEPSNFIGNQLCGLPLPNKCSANGTIQNTRNGRGENDKGFVTDWFWFGMAYGFVIGFWSVFLPLRWIGGLVPRQLGNISSLQHLNLYAGDEYNLHVANLQWLSGLSSLKHLDLGNVNLTKASNWLKVLNTLPSLKKLYLPGCQLLQVPPPINLNRSSLANLDLSSNSFENTGVVDFSWIFHLKSLVSLDLSHNDLKGRVFDGLANMTSLRHLDLSFNAFNSSIPEWLYNLNSLQFLNLGSNSLKGLISSAIGNMSSAISLDFSENELEGVIPKSRGNLCNLKSIVFTSVNLSQDVSDGLEFLSGCVSKQLDVLDLSSYKAWIRLAASATNYVDCHLIGQIPSSTQLQSLDSSSCVGNQLCGLPLPDKCSTNGAIHDIENESGESDNGFETDWFWCGMAYGFVIGFWGVIGLLLLGPFNFSNKFRKSITL
ncbi:hypothetical protein QUC31_016424 [Theobroma cacao]